MTPNYTQNLFLSRERYEKHLKEKVLVPVIDIFHKNVVLYLEIRSVFKVEDAIKRAEVRWPITRWIRKKFQGRLTYLATGRDGTLNAVLYWYGVSRLHTKAHTIRPKSGHRTRFHIQLSSHLPSLALSQFGPLKTPTANGQCLALPPPKRAPSQLLPSPFFLLSQESSAG